MKVHDFLNALCSTLERDPNSLAFDDTPKTVEQWDSIGHLSIIATMDALLGVPVMEEDLHTFQSIGELVQRLRARHALED
jgi:acyl carrier protein